MRIEQITESSTLADVAQLQRAFGVTITTRPEVDGYITIAITDEDGITASCRGASLAEALRVCFAEYVDEAHRATGHAPRQRRDH